MKIEFYIPGDYASHVYTLIGESGKKIKRWVIPLAWVKNEENVKKENNARDKMKNDLEEMNINYDDLEIIYKGV